MKYLILWLITLPVLGQNSVPFVDVSWPEALAKAEREGKMVFLYAHSETSCAPCRALEKYTFQEEKVVEVLSQSFVPVRLDMDEYPGLVLTEDYDIDILPSLLFIDGKGELVHRSCGAIDGAEILELVKEAQSPDKNSRVLQKEYEAGKRDVAFMEQYMWTLEIACADIEQFLRSHFEDMPVSEMIREGNWYVIMEYVNSVYSRAFIQLLENQEAFTAQYGAEDVQSKILDVFEIEYYGLASAGDYIYFGMQSLEYLAKQYDFQYKDDFLNTLSFGMAEMTEDWDRYADAAVQFIKPELEDPELLQDVCWKFYLFVDDADKLAMALTWSKFLLDNQDPDPALIDIYASLLYRSGNTREAIKYEKEALKMAEDWEMDTAHYEYQLSSFKENP
jgi:thioredoxin-related protein